MQRDLISYEQLTTMELQHICEARKLSLPPNLRPLKKNYRNLLEDLDDNGTTFGEFTQLPAESRVQIYEYHIAYLRLRMEAHKLRPSNNAGEAIYELVIPPPLAMSSKALRDDFLPLLFAHFHSTSPPTSCVVLHQRVGLEILVLHSPLPSSLSNVQSWTAGLFTSHQPV